MRLRRTMNDKVLGGVCGGIAREMDLPSNSVRWAFVLLVLFAGLSIWVYAIAWLLVPSDLQRIS